uniref:ferritin heavy chain B-like isoform X2 n=2 Tax=Myxine glutinosa TaxID=7769 RepID=UPI00358E7A5A
MLGFIQSELSSQGSNPDAAINDHSATTMAADGVSQIRENYHKDCEAGVNRQINLDMYASYVNISMSFYFSRDDVALENFARFFQKRSHKERDNAEKLMSYQNQRGGRVYLQDVKKPEKDDWNNGLEAMQLALQLEKEVNTSLLDLHGVASDKNDPHLSDFLEREFLDEQVQAIKKLGDFVTDLKRLGVPADGTGEYLFDKLTLKD